VISRICILGLRFHARHGCLPEEREKGQEFVLDAEIYYDAREAALGDDLGRAVDYHPLVNSLYRVATTERFDLLEALAFRLMGEIFSRPPVQRARIRLHKPHAPLDHKPEDLFFELEMTREEMEGFVQGGRPVGPEIRWHRVFLGLGSNLGDRLSHLREALSHLEERGILVEKASSVYRTAPWGLEEQPDFLNMVVMAATSLSPRELLEACQEVEREMGRERRQRWGPRNIDVDILLYDDIVVDEEDLVIPHPRMVERDFVIVPLLEIWPGAVDPRTGWRFRPPGTGRVYLECRWEGGSDG